MSRPASAAKPKGNCPPSVLGGQPDALLRPWLSPWLSTATRRAEIPHESGFDPAVFLTVATDDRPQTDDIRHGPGAHLSTADVEARAHGPEPAQTSKQDEPHITPGQRRVVVALLSSEHAMTYEGVADQLGIGLGTVHTHLRRLRESSPELYVEVMALRRAQLDRRHTLAVWRAQAHSDNWHRAQSARRHYRLFGCWPHERKIYKQLGRLDLLEALRRSRGYRRRPVICVFIGPNFGQLAFFSRDHAVERRLKSALGGRRAPAIRG